MPVRDPLIIRHYREKTIDAVAFFSKNTNYCGPLKLFKLLYFLDFINFRETGVSVTNLQYFAWKEGPIPQELYHELYNPAGSGLRDYIGLKGNPDVRYRKQSWKGFSYIEIFKQFDGIFFNKGEKRILTDLKKEFSDYYSEDMAEDTFLKNKPWENTYREKANTKIDYMLSVDGSDNRQLQIGEIIERQNEIEEIRRVLE